MATPPQHPLRQPRTLDDLFLYRLTRLTSTAGAPVVRMCEREHGVTRREWRLLAVLALADGIRPSVLAERALLDRARTSRALGSLVDKGLVERRSAPADRREARLCLSPAGRATYAALWPKVAALNRGLLAVLDDAELAQLDSLLTRLSAHAVNLAHAERLAHGAAAAATPPLPTRPAG